MKVIGVGFGRTGTMSLKVALEELGAGPCLHSLQSPNAGGAQIATHWEQAANGQQIDWQRAFDGWAASVDWLGARFYPQMLQAWPQAKVILSVRDPDAWYESCQASLHATRAIARSAEASEGSPTLLRAVDVAIWRDLFDDRFDDRDHALEIFQRHQLQVAGAVAPQQLLIYDIRDGWEPLCEFLQVAAPKTPFPHLNSREAFWSRLGARPAPAAAEVASVSRRPLRPHAGEQAASAAEPKPAPTRMLGLSSVDPEESFDQQQMLELLGLADDEFAQRIFARCGVTRRRMHISPKMLETNLQGRTAEVEEFLFQSAVQAVEKLDVDPARIGTIISASLYSLGGPPLSYRLIEHFKMSPATDKYHLVGVGCASAVPLIRLAQRCLPEHRDKLCLIVGAESMSGLLTRASEQDPRSKTVGSSIFGDGCAAMLIGSSSADSDGPQILASQMHQIPDSLGAVCMQLQPADSYLHLIRELPDLAGEHLGDLVDRFLASVGMTGHMIDHWMIHPGGRRIIDCVREALNLPYQEAETSYQMLAEHGNVGTPSIFYVIEHTIEQRRPQAGEHGLAITIGPGVSVGLMLLRW